LVDLSFPTALLSLLWTEPCFPAALGSWHVADWTDPSFLSLPVSHFAGWVDLSFLLVADWIGPY